MLGYVEKLSKAPWKIVEEDVEALRAVGFVDIAILHINLAASYYAYVNRIASGLGVPLEDFWSNDE